jgi:hypothetical protein
MLYNKLLKMTTESFEHRERIIWLCWLVAHRVFDTVDLDITFLRANSVCIDLNRTCKPRMTRQLHNSGTMVYTDASMHVLKLKDCSYDNN